MKGPHLLRVKFPSVGTLIYEEPVSMDGVQVGQVAKIEYTPDAALVTLEFFTRIKIPIDSRIVNFNHSMMGARMIFIERGHSRHYMDFSQEQIGVFDDGVAEMLHKAGEILTMVNRYKGIIDEIAFGSDSTQSFPKWYQNIFVPLVEKTLKLNTQINEIEQDISNKTQLALNASIKLKNLSRKTVKTIPNATQNLTHFTVKLDSIVSQIDTFIVMSNQQINTLHTQESAFTRLINEKELFILLERTNQAIKDLIKFLTSDGIDVNIHLWGTNPTKKKKRQ